jgi:cobalt-zinc-cadmium efflux system protein
MPHHHSHHFSGKKLLIAIILNSIITGAQIVGGILSGSLALLSDALHNFSDVLSLLISYVAHRIAHKKGDLTRTFGYKRAEILATLFNASALIAIGLYLIYEAIVRLFAPEAVDSQWVIWLGLLGIVVNGGSILLLHRDSAHNMNIKAAYLHLLGDVLTSVAVVLGGILIAVWEIYWIDPIISILIALYLIYASLDLVRESSSILMQFAPVQSDLQDIAQSVGEIDPVANIHHIHLWRLDDHTLFLEAHIEFKENLRLTDTAEVLEEIESLLKERYGITHTTLQAEYRRCENEALLGDEA